MKTNATRKLNVINNTCEHSKVFTVFKSVLLLTL